MPRLKSARNTKIKKKCVKSTAYPCGFTCIARYMPDGKERICRNVLRGQADTFSKWLKMTEERLAKVNAYRSSKGKDTLALKNDVALAKVKSPERQLIDGIKSGKVEPIPTTELGKLGRAVFKGKQEIDRKLSGMEQRASDRLRKLNKQSTKNDYAFTDDPATNKALEKALKGNDVAMERFIKRLGETDLDTAVKEVLETSDSFESAIAKAEKGNRESNRKVKESLEGWEKYKADTVAETQAEADGKLSHLSDYRKGRSITQGIEATPGDVIPFGKKTDSNVRSLDDARVTSQFKKGDLVGALRTAASQSVRDSDRMLQELDGLKDELSTAQQELNASYDKIHRLASDSLAKYKPLGDDFPGDRPVESKPTGQSNPKSQLEALKAEENRLGKQLDALLNKYTGRRTPAQQSEIDALLSEYRKVSRAVRNFNQGKPVTPSSNDAAIAEGADLKRKKIDSRTNDVFASQGLYDKEIEEWKNYVPKGMTWDEFVGNEALFLDALEKRRQARKKNLEDVNTRAKAEDYARAVTQIKTGIILGVKLTGNQKQDYEKVKSAYRKLAKKHHPDHGGKAADFRRIQAEWETFNNKNEFSFSETRSPYRNYRR